MSTHTKMKSGEQIHIVHDRENRQTFGYVVTPVRTGLGGLKLEVAQAICAPKDNFNKKVARAIVKTRLESGRTDANTKRVLTAIDFSGELPKTASEWRGLENALISFASEAFPEPAARQALDGPFNE